MATTPDPDALPPTSSDSVDLDDKRPESVPPFADDDKPPRDFRFWLVFLGISIATLITAIELSAVSVALPTIVKALDGSSFIWVGSAYTLASTAVIPLVGGLAQIFGRRPVILGSLLVMILGSALSGAATSMNFLIAGRAVQGIGGGGISATTTIIISDMVPLHERGAFNGLIGIAWSVASGIGPIIGGALAQNGQWRWLFYLNIPIAGVAAVLMALFLRVPTPPGTMMQKLAKMDWIGNGLVIAATTSCVIALTWSGTQYAWSAVPVVVPLVLGLVGLAAFLVYEAIVPKTPLVPFVLMSTATGISGYVQTFIMPIVMMGLIYYFPVYFQACKGASPIGSGVDELPFALIMAPFGIIAGASVNKTGRYRLQIWVAWVILLLGTGLQITLEYDTPRGHALGFLVLCGIGLGILATTTYFPVLAPLPVSQNGPALAFFIFLRNFAQVWGITIGGTVLQNQLEKRLPPAFRAQLPSGTAIAYATIPLVRGLAEPLQTEVRIAFAQSLRIVWAVLVGIGGIGLAASLAMRALPLRKAVDKNWALERSGEELERSGGEQERTVGAKA
ncbi:uncharacterized protein FIBRA_06239 [Fibroporia radiculosa]|uniref:Major facilitator superfamily (MFS) profile domain-containing protein n=1 Tax=Fibroporia radiculosa TaxID=599839 RepID=J4GSE2_9APHY|nr:uncharacterized protein FIBRA_06239 [Fibroporia radiculosa]CCM04080.1 predicted protein [Fibroporia radiculosa]